jgi:hypothetical protein
LSHPLLPAANQLVCQINGSDRYHG